MLRDYRAARRRPRLMWAVLLAGAVGVLLAAGGCGAISEEDETSDPDASQAPTPAPTSALTAVDLPDLVLQRSDVPVELELLAIENESEVEYKTEYAVPDPEPTLTGLRSVASTVRLGNASFPSLSKVESLQRHTLDAVEIPDTGNFGENSVLYRVTVLADKAEHHIYYGYINHGGLGATLIAVQGTLPEPTPEELKATLADVLVLMQSQEARLLASSGP